MGFWSSWIHGLTSKSTPVNADEIPLIDTEASNVGKKLTLTNLKAFLKTYFDGLYGTGSGDVVGPASAVDSNFAGFNTTTGKLIKDSGSKAADFATAGHNHDASYAPLAKGVTNGDSHDHNGGDGAQIAYSSLSGTPSIPTQYTDAMAVDAVEAADESTNALVGATDYLLAVIGGVLKRIKPDNAAKGYQTLVLGPGGWPSTTAGSAAVTKWESSTNKQNFQTLDFDKDSSENAEWTVVMPDNYDGGTVTAIFLWTAAAGTATQTVIWGLQGRAYADDAALDQAWGTAQTVSDALLATGDLHISGATSAITLAGSPAGGQLVQFRAYRDISDTLAADARLLCVKVEYGINKWSA